MPRTSITALERQNWDRLVKQNQELKQEIERLKQRQSELQDEADALRQWGDQLIGRIKEIENE